MSIYAEMSTYELQQCLIHLEYLHRNTNREDMKKEYEKRMYEVKARILTSNPATGSR